MGVAGTGVRRLVGFDQAGEVFLATDRILRGIYPGDAESVRRTLRACNEYDLFAHGIVSTVELETDPFPEFGYETVLQHTRVPFVTYPHEWAASMLKDAALLHVQLFLDLGARGLTLKDWHPYNILFEGTTPRFIDFTSIIPIEELPCQAYLEKAAPAPRHAWRWDAIALAMYRMYRITCEPYFIIPMIMMQQGRHAVARQRLIETALNSGNSVITRGEAFAGSPLARLRYEVRDLAITATLAERGELKRRFLERVRRAIDKIRVSPGDSAYSSYYSDKKEAFSTVPSAEWTSKQHFVRDALVELEPSTVLDFGSNTGWFSILAARLGASVVAVDVDEASIDTLYRAARRDKLDILPLVANLAHPVADLPSATFDDEPVLSRIGGDPPLYPSPLSRLRCEMVMALAIVHHLVLGQGLTFEMVAELLGGLAERHLCIEFVDLSDEMIVSDPGFFPALQAAPRSFEWYTLENLITHLRREFREVSVRPSHPSTRSLLVCSR